MIKLYEIDYNRHKILQLNRQEWLIVSCIVALIIPTFYALYLHELDHIAFDQSASELSCIDLEQLILGTHEYIDPHFVEESWDRISAIHVLKCKS